METSMSETGGSVEKLWTVKDVMRVLNVKKSWIYARTDSNELPHIRLGSAIRFDPAEVLAYINKCKVKPAKLLSLRREQ